MKKKMIFEYGNVDQIRESFKTQNLLSLDLSLNPHLNHYNLTKLLGKYEHLREEIQLDIEYINLQIQLVKQLLKEQEK